MFFTCGKQATYVFHDYSENNIEFAKTSSRKILNSNRKPNHLPVLSIGNPFSSRSLHGRAKLCSTQHLSVCFGRSEAKSSAPWQG